VAVPGAGGPHLASLCLSFLPPDYLFKAISVAFREKEKETKPARAREQRQSSPANNQRNTERARSLRIERARRKKKMEQEEACSSYCSSSLRQCRICHDEEDERRSAMESPCACSGSLKVCALCYAATRMRIDRPMGSCILFSTFCSVL
jgi:hypothetical protein